MHLQNPFALSVVFEQKGPLSEKHVELSGHIADRQFEQAGELVLANPWSATHACCGVFPVEEPAAPVPPAPEAPLAPPAPAEDAHWAEHSLVHAVLQMQSPIAV